jgi:beta-phosphoglucomutase
MKTKTAFIFDLDGVIVDTAKYHFIAWQKLAGKLDIHFTEKENEQLKGVSRVKSLEKILNWGNKTITDELFQQLMDEKNQDYLSLISKMDDAEILPGVKPFLESLQKNDHPIALGSASKNAKTILKAVNLLDAFDTIVDGNHVEKGKPDPEVFLKACKQLNVNPKNAVVFEDSIAGIQAANSGGMLSVGIGQKDVLYEADYCFENFKQFDYQYFHKIISQIEV